MRPLNGTSQLEQDTQDIVCGCQPVRLCFAAATSVLHSRLMHEVSIGEFQLSSAAACSCNRMTSRLRAMTLCHLHQHHLTHVPRCVFEQFSTYLTWLPVTLLLLPRQAGFFLLGTLRTGPGMQVLHRLDMDTSGVLLFSKHSQVTAEMHRQFRAREIHKQYVAVCAGIPSTASAGRFSQYIHGSLTPQGETLNVNASIDRHPTIGPAACLHPDGKPASTVLQVLDSCPATTWEGHHGEAWFQEQPHSMQGACVLRCQPLTGALLNLHLQAS